MIERIRNFFLICGVITLFLPQSFCYPPPNTIPVAINYLMGYDNYQGEFSLSIAAIKGNSIQVFSHTGPLKINFKGNQGNEYLRFQFKDLAFPEIPGESSHNKRLKLEVSLVEFEGVQLGSAITKVELVSKQKKSGTKYFQMDLSLLPSSNGKVVFAFKVLDRTGRVLGNLTKTTLFEIWREKPMPSYSEDASYPSQEPSEEQLWERIRASNELEPFMQYRRQYPEGKYTDIARKRILEIREEDSWVSAREKNDCAAFQDYLDFYPSGIYRDKAKQAIARLACNKKKKSDPPPPPPVDPEKVAFEEAERQGSEEAYKFFLTTYPEGKFSSLAVSRLPMEKVSEDYREDSIFTVIISQVNPPLTISSIRVVQDNKFFDKSLVENGIDPFDSGQEFSWPEGNFYATFESLGAHQFVFKAIPQQGKTYELTLEDSDGKRLDLELDAEFPSLELIQVTGFDLEEDTLKLRIKGGVAPYFARFVELGNPVDSYEREQALGGENEFLVVKGDLVDRGLIQDAYELYVLDSRKTLYKKYEEPIAFAQSGIGFELQLWQILAPVLVLLIIALVIYYRKKSTS